MSRDMIRQWMGTAFCCSQPAFRRVWERGLFHIPRLAQHEHGSKFKGGGSLTKFNQDKFMGILSRFINENKEFNHLWGKEWEFGGAVSGHKSRKLP